MTNLERMWLCFPDLELSKEDGEWWACWDFTHIPYEASFPNRCESDADLAHLVHIVLCAVALAEVE